jgi:hypothetical protein
MKYFDARDVEILLGDKVLLTNGDYIRVGEVIGFKDKSDSESNWRCVGARVVVKTKENERPVLIQSYRWTLVCIRQLAKDVL